MDALDEFDRFGEATMVGVELDAGMQIRKTERILKAEAEIMRTVRAFGPALRWSLVRLIMDRGFSSVEGHFAAQNLLLEGRLMQHRHTKCLHAAPYELTTTRVVRRPGARGAWRRFWSWLMARST